MVQTRRNPLFVSKVLVHAPWVELGMARVDIADVVCYALPCCGKQLAVATGSVCAPPQVVDHGVYPRSQILAACTLACRDQLLPEACSKISGLTRSLAEL